MKTTKTTKTIKVYDHTNARLRSGQHAEPQVSVYMARSGSFRLSTGLTKLMGLKPGDCVVVLRDEDEWYLAKSPEGLRLSQCSGSRGCSVRFSSRIIVTEIEEATEIHAPASFLVSKKPTDINGYKAFAILISSAKPATSKQSAQ
jgi:hypothetical protein